MRTSLAYEEEEENWVPRQPPRKDVLQQYIKGPFRQVLTNEGTDYIDYGRPTWAVDNLRPSVDEFKVKFKGILDDNTGSRTIVAFGAESGTKETQQLCIFFSAGQLKFRVGGENLNAGTYSIGDYVEAELVVSTTGYTATANGILYTQNSIGSVTGITNLYIGGRTNGTSANYEGKIWDVEFYDGNNYSLEVFPLNGSPDGVNGTTGTITDGAPNTVWDYNYAPDLSQSGNYALQEAEAEVVAVASADRPVLNFDGQDYALFSGKTYTTPTDYELVYKGKFTTSNVTPANRLFKLTGSGNEITVFVQSSRLTVFSSGSPNGQHPTALNNGQIYSVEVWYRLGQVELFIDGLSSGDLSINGLPSYDSIELGQQGQTATDFQVWDTQVFDGKLNITGTGSTITSSNGDVFTISDGTPTTIHDFGIANKINLNPEGEASLPYPNSYETRATLATYHDGAIDFVTLNDGFNHKNISYPTGTVLTAQEIDRANTIVRR